MKVAKLAACWVELSVVTKVLMKAGSWVASLVAPMAAKKVDNLDDRKVATRVLSKAVNSVEPMAKH